MLFLYVFGFVQSSKRAAQPHFNISIPCGSNPSYSPPFSPPPPPARVPTPSDKGKSKEGKGKRSRYGKYGEEANEDPRALIQQLREEGRDERGRKSVSAESMERNVRRQSSKVANLIKKLSKGSAVHAALLLGAVNKRCEVLTNGGARYGELGKEFAYALFFASVPVLGGTRLLPYGC